MTINPTERRRFFNERDTHEAIYAAYNDLKVIKR